MGAFPPSCRTGRQADTREQKQTKSVPYLIIIIIDFFESAYPAAQSAEQAYTHNVHRDGKCYIYIYIKRTRYQQGFLNTVLEMHTRTHARTHAHTHTRTRVTGLKKRPQGRPRAVLKISSAAPKCLIVKSLKTKIVHTVIKRKRHSAGCTCEREKIIQRRVNA